MLPSWTDTLAYAAAATGDHGRINSLQHPFHTTRIAAYISKIKENG
jgi:hypothetical protein